LVSRWKVAKTDQCKICGRKQALIKKYNLVVCRQCFREVARDLGFEKYR
jgi:small subunit ribosomal protein S14